MRATELKDERDRKHALKEERRHRARTYKDKRPMYYKERPDKEDEGPSPYVRRETIR